MSSLEGATQRAEASECAGGFVICTGPHEFPLNQQDWALAAHLASQGERVLLVLNGNAGLVEHTWLGCRVVAWPSGRPATLSDARFFWRLLGQARPQAVLATFFSVHMSMLLALARRVPVRVAWYRTLRVQDRLDSTRNWWRQRAIEMGKALSMMAATHVVAVSPAGKRDVCFHYPVPASKCSVFHTCRRDPWELLGDERPTRSVRPLIVSVGRMVQSKGQDLLLRALARIREIEPDWDTQLVLVGAGRMQEHYASLARELGVAGHVRFTGALSQAEAYRQMAQAHVAAFPFRSDPGPGVLVEALGLGLPVVASTRTGAAELMGGSLAISLVAPDDAEALTQALLAVLRDEERMEAMKRAARELFLSRFHLDHWVQGASHWLGEAVLNRGGRSANIDAAPGASENP